MKKTCSLEDAAVEIGVGRNQILKIIDEHPDIFSGIETRANTPNITVSVSSLEAFKSLYEGAYSFIEIANRLGVSINRIQKVKTSTPGTCFLERSFCAPQTCPKSGRPSVKRIFPKADAEAFIEYCETRSIFKLMQPGVRVKAFTYATLEKEDFICGSKAYRFKDAMQDGLNPQKYRSSDIAPGEYLGKLVFKVWGRRSVIQCFFVLSTDELIRLTAFRPHATPWRGYTPRDGRVDFSEAGIEGTRYKLTTGLTERGIVSFLSAKAV
ncbi:MAG: hypothetical protein MI863_10345 [Desulfobacterales bacterium]|nr:hypothetical protein [Desulfobacterales bacterium]